MIQYPDQFVSFCNVRSNVHFLKKDAYFTKGSSISSKACPFPQKGYPFPSKHSHFKPPCVFRSIRGLVRTSRLRSQSKGSGSNRVKNQAPSGDLHPIQSRQTTNINPSHEGFGTVVGLSRSLARGSEAMTCEFNTGLRVRKHREAANRAEVRKLELKLIGRHLGTWKEQSKAWVGFRGHRRTVGSCRGPFRD